MARAQISPAPTRVEIVDEKGFPTRRMQGYLQGLGVRIVQLGGTASLTPLDPSASLAECVAKVNEIVALLNETEVAAK